VFIYYTVVISGISSVLSLIAINRFFRMYYMNMKSAFKVDYGHNFIKINNGGMKEYQPEDEEEIEDIRKY
jgi:ribosome biogenesis protein Tsr3